MAKILYKLKDAPLVVKNVVLYLLIFTSVDHIFPSGTGILSIEFLIKLIVIVIVIWICTGLFIPEFIERDLKRKRRKEDMKKTS